MQITSMTMKSNCKTVLVPEENVLIIISTSQVGVLSNGTEYQHALQEGAQPEGVVFNQIRKYK